MFGWIWYFLILSSFLVEWLRNLSCLHVWDFLQFSEEFNSGFGSHTPMILGQAKVVRYYPNYERYVLIWFLYSRKLFHSSHYFVNACRTLDVAKTVIKDKLYVYNKEDKKIDLSKDGKLEDVSSFTILFNLFVYIHCLFTLHRDFISVIYNFAKLLLYEVFKRSMLQVSIPLAWFVIANFHCIVWGYVSYMGILKCYYTRIISVCFLVLQLNAAVA